MARTHKGKVGRIREVENNIELERTRWEGVKLGGGVGRELEG